MIEIPLNEIKHGKDLLRSPTSGDIDELAESLKSMGLLVPIMVKKNGTGYICVFGNRRLVASKKAGLKTIMALEADPKMTDNDLIAAALTENSARENMSSLELSEAIARLKKAGFTNAQLEKMLGLKRARMNDLARLVSEPLEIQKLMKGCQSSAPPLTERHVAATRVVKNEEDRIKLAKAAQKKEMTSREIRRRAPLLNRAQSPEVKEKIIEAPSDSGWLDKRYVKAAERRAASVERKNRYSTTKEPLPVRKMLDGLLETTKAVPEWLKTNPSPEGARFTVRRIDSLIESLQTLKKRMARIGG